MPRIPFNECDGVRLKGVIAAGCKWVGIHRNKLDEINYFPCADFDTGRNLYITFLSVIAEMKKISYSAGCCDAAKAVAIGSLMGSRGNAGLIFSQFFCGFADSIATKEVINGNDLAKALTSAAVAAKEGVANPVEGTILTTAADLAFAAESANKHNKDILGVLEVAFQTSKELLPKTKEINPHLAKADVVDAGSQALVYFLEGMVRYSYRLPFYRNEEEKGFSNSAKSIEPRYCLDFILRRNIDIQAGKIKELLKDIGTNLIVAGGVSRLIKIHLHTNNPFLAIERCSSLGEASNIRMDDLTNKNICE
jgi:dihydroxyacetone kinase-like predicted kinase